MADFTTFAVFPMSGENSHFPSSKETLKVQLLLGVLGKITCAIVNSCDYSTRLWLVLQTSHSLAILVFPTSKINSY